MNQNIDAAIAERSVIKSEFDGCRRYLAEANEVYPISPTEYNRVLLRMHLQEENMRYLDKCIIDGLSRISITLFPYNKTAQDEV